jgi:hypothetical protein
MGFRCPRAEHHRDGLSGLGSGSKGCSRSEQAHRLPQRHAGAQRQQGEHAVGDRQGPGLGVAEEVATVPWYKARYIVLWYGTQKPLQAISAMIATTQGSMPAGPRAKVSRGPPASQRNGKS